MTWVVRVTDFISWDCFIVKIYRASQFLFYFFVIFFLTRSFIKKLLSRDNYDNIDDDDDDDDYDVDDDGDDGTVRKAVVSMMVTTITLSTMLMIMEVVECGMKLRMWMVLDSTMMILG